MTLTHPGSSGPRLVHFTEVQNGRTTISIQFHVILARPSLVRTCAAPSAARWLQTYISCHLPFATSTLVVEQMCQNLHGSSFLRVCSYRHVTYMCGDPAASFPPIVSAYCMRMPQ